MILELKHGKYLTSVNFSLSLMVLIFFIGDAFAQTTVTVDEDEATWGFLDETVPGPGSVTGEFVQGPDTPPAGAGSVRLALGAMTDGVVIGTQTHAGVRLADILTLTYATYQNMAPQALALQFNVDYDDTDTTTSWQGRLVYEPSNAGAVLADTWQTWDTLSGNWWSTGTPVVGDTGSAALCIQGSPCSWADVLTNYPDIAIQSGALAGILFKAGSGWPAGFDGNADRLHIQTAGFNIIYDFETNVPVELQSFSIE